MPIHRIPEDVLDQHSEDFPHIRTYHRCQREAFRDGFYAIITTSAAVFIAQLYSQKWLRTSTKLQIVTPLACGILAGYVVGYYRTKQCQKMWLALEDKHTAFTGLEEG